MVVTRPSQGAVVTEGYIDIPATFLVDVSKAMAMSIRGSWRGSMEKYSSFEPRCFGCGAQVRCFFSRVRKGNAVVSASAGISLISSLTHRFSVRARRGGRRASGRGQQRRTKVVCGGRRRQRASSTKTFEETGRRRLPHNIQFGQSQKRVQKSP